MIKLLVLIAIPQLSISADDIFVGFLLMTFSGFYFKMCVNMFIY